MKLTNLLVLWGVFTFLIGFECLAGETPEIQKITEKKDDKEQNSIEYNRLNKLSDKELLRRVLSINVSYKTSSEFWNKFTATPIDAYSGKLLVLRVIGERGRSIVPVLISLITDKQDTNIKLYYDFDKNGKTIKLDTPIKLQMNYICTVMLRKILGGSPKGTDSYNFIISSDKSKKIKHVWAKWWQRNKNKSWNEYSKDNFLYYGE